MLAGHLDTVVVDGYPDAFSARVEDGRVYGRGSCDMKGGLAAFLEVVDVLAASGTRPRGDLLVAGIMDEEYGTLGSLHIREHGPTADFGIVAEPSSLTLCPAHRGQVGVVVRTFGKAAHSSRPELGDNAILRMVQAIEALEPYAEQLQSEEPHPLCGHGSFNLGVIHGGTIASVVPDACEMELDRRVLPGESYNQVEGEIDALLAPVAAADSGFRYELSGPTWYLPPLDVPVDSPIVRLVSRAHEAVTGDMPPVAAFPAATDAPNLGMPAVVYGPGSMNQAHTTDEYTTVSEIVTAAKVYLEAVLAGLRPADFGSQTPDPGPPS
jgi:acetylornithine deacetylase